MKFLATVFDFDATSSILLTSVSSVDFNSVSAETSIFDPFFATDYVE